MLKGGYQIIDLENKSLTPEVGVVYEGIYDTIENTNKAILVSGLVVNHIPYSDMFVPFSVSGSNYDSEVINGEFFISISDIDVVTIRTDL